MNQEFPADEVLIEVRDGVAVVTLNRPEVLNALSLEMIRQISAALNGWKDDASVEAVVFRGAGDRAFCSGGDIKSFYRAGMDCRRGLVGPRVPVVFFAEEYSLNKQIFDYSKPTVALMDGYVMGGGYGIAGHCSVRVATGKTLLAMPETKIGFFPDVGSVYHLQKCSHHYGRYLALTGESIDGRTAVALGLADFYVEDMADEAAVIAAALDGSLSAEGQGGDLEHAAVIEAAFADLDMAAILAWLEADGGAFALATLEALQQRSPVSLMVVASYLEQSAEFDFEACIAMDFVLVQHFIRQADMYEGIRAQLIDKDRAPQWSVGAVANISPDDVKTYFTSTGYDLKDVQIF